MLYIVATPIGNLKDISLRALQILKEVDVIAAEDTRTSGVLLHAHNIATPMLSYHDFSNEQQVEKILSRLRAGQRVALISDAGTPLISDPGYRLVRAARLEGIAVIPIPGASALLAAVSASGLAVDRFSFEGFLPAKQTARLKHLRSLVDESRALVFYEAPHRLLGCLTDMLEVFSPQRDVVLAREMTKLFETFKLASLVELKSWIEHNPQQLKGECVLVVAGKPKRAVAVHCIDAEVMRIARLIAAELPPKKAAVLVAEITGVNKQEIYKALVAGA